MAIEINNHPGFPGDEKCYDALLGVREKVNAAKSRPSFTRVNGRMKKDARRTDGERGIYMVGEKESGDFRPFGNAAGRREEILRTCLKAVYVCRYIPALSSPISQEHPSLSKATLRCRLQDSKFVSDKQNKHGTASSASASLHAFRFSFSLSPEQKKPRHSAVTH